MTPSKKQINEVTAIANEMGVSVEKALSCLSNCSLSIYKVIGAKGVVESAMDAQEINTATKAGGVSFDRCVIVGSSEKAYLLALPTEAGGNEKWVAKSAIKEIDGNTIVPFWAIK